MKIRKAGKRGFHRPRVKEEIPEKSLPDDDHVEDENNRLLLNATINSIERHLPSTDVEGTLHSDFTKEQEDKINDILRKLNFEDQINDGFLVDCASLSSKISSLMKSSVNGKTQEDTVGDSIANDSSKAKSKDIDIDEWLDDIL